MNRRNTLLIAAFVAAAMVLPNIVQAMEIRQFDKMSQDDRAEYVSELISGAEKVLTHEGRTDQAQKVESLFSTNGPDGKVSIGMGEFMINLARLRVADAERVAANPRATRLEVEHAMALTLKQNDVVLPPSFMHVGDDFKPNFPAATASAPPQQ